MKILFVAVKYSLRVSPTVKYLISFLVEKKIGCILVADKDGILREPIPGLSTKRLTNSLIDSIQLMLGKSGRANRFPFRHLLELLFALDALKRRAQVAFYARQCRFVFCVEAQALVLAHRSSVPQSRIIYMSMELESQLGLLGANPRDILQKCLFCTIQSQERRNDLEEFVGGALDCMYLPVSLRPRQINTRNSESEEVLLVHSGYFSKWACLTELVDSFTSLEAQDCRLYLQGHSMGTEEYLELVSNRAVANDRITIDTGYYGDEPHHALLCRHHIGVAVYLDDGTPNWQNLVFSSGKIAAYLWAGLPIITNIRHELTKSEPFLYVENMTNVTLEHAISNYRRSPALYHASAYRLAESHYNLDVHAQKILDRLCLEGCPQ